MRRSVQPNCPRAMTCCFFVSLKMLAMPAEEPRSLPPRQRLERLLPMAGFGCPPRRSAHKEGITLVNWLVKEEPTHYGFDALVKDKKAVWSGVGNALAQKHLRAVKKGDRIFYYHTGDEKAIRSEERRVGKECRERGL